MVFSLVCAVLSNKNVYFYIQKSNTASGQIIEFMSLHFTTDLI